MKIELSDNRIDGKTKKVTVEKLVQDFHKWLKTDDAPNIQYVPFDRALLQFLLSYEIAELKYYGTISDELWNTIYQEHKNQKNECKDKRTWSM